MKYSDIKRSVIANFQRGNKLVPFIEGKPGGGKSSLARSIIHELGIKPERVTEIRNWIERQVIPTRAGRERG